MTAFACPFYPARATGCRSTVCNFSGAAQGDFAGVLASMYGQEDGGADTAVWLAESKEGTSWLRPNIARLSIAYQTIETLRENGLMGDVIETKEGLIGYPAILEAH